MKLSQLAHLPKMPTNYSSMYLLITSDFPLRRHSSRSETDGFQVILWNMESRHCIILHQIFARLIRGLNRGRSQFIMAMNCVLREIVSRLVWKKSKYFCVKSTICFGPGKPRGSLPLGSLVAVLEACRTMRRQCNLVQIRKTHPVQVECHRVALFGNCQLSTLLRKRIDSWIDSSCNSIGTSFFSKLK